MFWEAKGSCSGFGNGPANPESDVGPWRTIDFKYVFPQALMLLLFLLIVVVIVAAAVVLIVVPFFLGLLFSSFFSATTVILSILFYLFFCFCFVVCEGFYFYF